MTSAQPAAHRARSVARLAAVQALYQMETAGTGSEAVIREFAEHRFDRDIAGLGALAPADEDFFGELVRGVVAEQARLDRAIRRRLAQGWRLERIDATLRAILRAAAFELACEDTPSPVVIDEYVEIANSFFDGPEPGFVNAALDAIAHDERAA